VDHYLLVGKKKERNIELQLIIALNMGFKDEIKE
jgi:hypothetical protein